MDAQTMGLGHTGAGRTVPKRDPKHIIIWTRLADLEHSICALKSLAEEIDGDFAPRSPSGVELKTPDGTPNVSVTLTCAADRIAVASNEILAIRQRLQEALF